MTYNEIMEALECCVYADYSKCHYDCPYKTNCRNLSRDALNLITHQQAEIDRLTSMNQAKLDTIHDLHAELIGIMRLKND